MVIPSDKVLLNFMSKQKLIFLSLVSTMYLVIEDLVCTRNVH